MAPQMNTLQRSKTSVVLLGGTGFIGRAIASQLAEIPSLELRVVSRGLQASRAAHHVVVRANVTDLDALQDVFRGADAVIHAASYIGRDDEQIKRTNVAGTSNVMLAAARANVQRVIYVSTAGVYGFGPFRGESERDIRPCPASVLSQSRRLAEEMVTAGGGIALRPNLTYGVGDRWFVPTLTSLIGRLGSRINNGDALVSVISTPTLASIVTALALSPENTLAGQELNCSHPTPVSIQKILDILHTTIRFKTPTTSLSLDDVLSQSQTLRLSGHQIQLLGDDNWFSSSKIWNSVNVEPEKDPFTLTARMQDWYLSL